MRSKEESAEYRYFPDPDLPPLVIEESWIREVTSTMPKLPEERVKELVEGYGLTLYDAQVLTAERSFVDFFQEVFAICQNAKLACAWVTSELFGALNKVGLDLKKSPVSSKNLGELLKLIDSETISGKMGKSVFEEMFASGRPPQEIVAEKGLKQITNDDEIRRIVHEVFAKNESQLQGYLAGNERLMMFFVGQVMKATSGSANPKKVNEVLAEELRKKKGGA
jgi:aspartyl-tRNA(Asn)/glutamyl-tRNA(Gln) amidotransferase subunit B